MTKSEAVRLLGGSVNVAAHMIGITASAVRQWPDVLPDAIRDRVQAALWRQLAGVGAASVTGAGRPPMRGAGA